LPKLAGVISSIACDESGFPDALNRLRRPLARLWYAGRLPPPSLPLLAMVGSRAASGKGRSWASEQAGRLASRGFGIVSGGALGIDAAAHQGALHVGMPTFAVLGCGVDVVYPDRHQTLFADIRRAGALLSEYPPGTAPRPGQFPVRNRIIVALARAVIVVEAAPRSGALVTAKLAWVARENTTLMAVPGSAGTDGLIARRQAIEVATADDVIEALAGRRSPGWSASAAAPVVPETLRDVVLAVEAGVDTCMALALNLHRPLAEILSVLSMAELEGWVRRTAGNRYEVSRGG
jgi:DNA processing protein